MTTDNTDPEDRRDPLVAALQDYRRAPRDIVPKKPWPVDQNADLDALGTGQPMTLSHCEITGDGVAVATTETVTRPVYAKD